MNRFTLPFISSARCAVLLGIVALACGGIKYARAQEIEPFFLYNAHLSRPTRLDLNRPGATLSFKKAQGDMEHGFRLAGAPVTGTIAHPQALTMPAKTIYFAAAAFTLTTAGLYFAGPVTTWWDGGTMHAKEAFVGERSMTLYAVSATGKGMQLVAPMGYLQPVSGDGSFYATFGTGVEVWLER